MPLTIAAIAVLGWGVVGLGIAGALLLAAALAPSDPVLESDVQVGPLSPVGVGDDDEHVQLPAASLPAEMIAHVVWLYARSR